MALKHKKVSLIADTEDTDLVRPSDWNADHQVSFNNAILKSDEGGNVVSATAGTDYLDGSSHDSIDHTGLPGVLAVPSVAPVILTNDGASSTRSFRFSLSSIITAFGSDVTIGNKPINGKWIVLSDYVIVVLDTALAAGASVPFNVEAGTSALPTDIATVGTDFTTNSGTFTQGGSVTYNGTEAVVPNGAILSSTTFDMVNHLLIVKMRGNQTSYSGTVANEFVCECNGGWITPLSINSGTDTSYNGFRHMSSSSQFKIADLDLNSHIASCLIESSTSRRCYFDGVYKTTLTYDATTTTNIQFQTSASNGLIGYVDYCYAIPYSTSGSIAVNPESTGLVTVGAGGISLTSPSTFVKAIDLATVATSGSYNDLNDKPSLGTAAAKNITISTEDPSGGSPGDIWIKYTP